VKKRLDRLKVHGRESYNDVIARLLSPISTVTLDSEILLETVEILSESDTMRSLAKSVDELKSGKLHSLEEV
jgi:predicted CopG family antitoxin